MLAWTNEPSTLEGAGRLLQVFGGEHSSICKQAASGQIIDRDSDQVRAGDSKAGPRHVVPFCREQVPDFHTVQHAAKKPKGRATCSEKWPLAVAHATNCATFLILLVLLSYCVSFATNLLKMHALTACQLSRHPTPGLSRRNDLVHATPATRKLSADFEVRRTFMRGTTRTLLPTLHRLALLGPQEATRDAA